MSARTPIDIDEELDDVVLLALAQAHATPPPPELRSRLLAAAASAPPEPARVEASAPEATRWRLVGSIAAGIVLMLGGLLTRQWTIASRLGDTLAAVQKTNAELLARLDVQATHDAELSARLDAQTRSNSELLAKLETATRTVTDIRRGLDGQAQVLTVLASSDTRVARLGAQRAEDAPVSGRVLLDSRSGEAALVIVDLRALDAAHTYELWAIRGKQAPEPAGLFVSANGATAVRMPRVDNPHTVTAFAVSIEPQGGSPQPTGPVVLVGAVQAS